MSAHICHWVGCKTHVPAHLWGCRAHWAMLPKSIRDKIWAAYRKGQEITKDPSQEYIAAALEAREYCIRVNARTTAVPQSPAEEA